MKYWYIFLLKMRYSIACLIITTGILITPFLMNSAYKTRGYFAIGGELVPLVLSFYAAALIIDGLGKLEKEYRRNFQEKNHQGRCKQYVNKVQAVRKNPDGSQLNKNRIRQGLRIEIKYKSFKFNEYSKTNPEEIKTKYRSFAIKIIKGNSINEEV